MDICRECSVLSGRSAYDGPIPRPKESYQVCVCVCVCVCMLLSVIKCNSEYYTYNDYVEEVRLREKGRKHIFLNIPLNMLHELIVY